MKILDRKMKAMSKRIITLRDSLKSFLKDPLQLSRWESEHTRDEDGRLSSWVHSGYRTIIGKYEYEGDLYMFNNDYHLRAVPYGRGTQEKFKAAIKPADGISEEILEGSDIEKVVSMSISKDRFGFNHLNENIADFIRDSVHTITAHAEIFYEIVCVKDSDGKITSLDFHYIFPPSMKKILGRYIQVIPYKVARQSHVKAGLRFIPKDHILHITAPKELGGKRELKSIIKRLAKLSGTVTPSFHIPSMERNEVTGFDFNTYVDRKYMEEAILTKKYGWNQRNYQDKHILEYYSMHRYLVAANATAMLRQHILQELNKALNNNYVKSGVEIVLEDLPTTETISKDFEKLQKGNLKFVDLITKD